MPREFELETQLATMQTEHQRVLRAHKVAIDNLAERRDRYKRKCKALADENAALRAARRSGAPPAAAASASNSADVATKRRRHVREALRLAHPDKSAQHASIDHTALAQHLTQLLELL